MKQKIQLYFLLFAIWAMMVTLVVTVLPRLMLERLSLFKEIWQEVVFIFFVSAIEVMSTIFSYQKFLYKTRKENIKYIILALAAFIIAMAMVFSVIPGFMHATYFFKKFLDAIKIILSWLPLFLAPLVLSFIVLRRYSK